MGFFSFLKPLIKTALPIIAGIAGVEAVGALAAPESKAEAQDLSGLTPAAQARVLAGTVVPSTALTPSQAIAARAIPVDSRGRLRQRTIVQTFDPLTGVITRSRTHAGGVAVFSADVAAARRINRQVRKLDARLPRKTVKPSQQKMLTDRLINNALERAGDEPCPK